MQASGSQPPDEAQKVASSPCGLTSGPSHNHTRPRRTPPQLVTHGGASPSKTKKKKKEKKKNTPRTTEEEEEGS
ncbi:hypothetical protein, partial [Pseudomonas aeruginosa]|uniref:hypothetical protein n=1 Tax=Pseudomonas aeruginosa TaxID=287 RepID=UPI001CA5D6EB